MTRQPACRAVTLAKAGLHAAGYNGKCGLTPAVRSLEKARAAPSIRAEATIGPEMPGPNFPVPMPDRLCLVVRLMALDSLKGVGDEYDVVVIGSGSPD